MIKKILLILLFSPLCFGATPTFTSSSGTLSNDQIVTVSGSNFGTENTTNYITYDNYDDPDNYPGTGYDGNPYATTNWQNSGKTPEGIWGKWSTSVWRFFVFEEESDDSSPPSFSATTAANFYSTGWGARKIVPRTASSVGVEGGSLATYTTGHSEVWIRYYQRFSMDMSAREEESKQMYIYFNTEGGEPYIMPHMYGSGGTFKWRVYYSNGGTTCFYGTTNGDCFADGAYFASYPGSDKWQEIKIRVKVNGASGIYQEWIDGTQVINLNPVNIGSTNVGWIRFGANFSGGTTDFLSVGQSMNEDWSSLAISTADPGSVAAVFLSNSSTWGSYAVGSVNWTNGTSTYVRQAVGGTGSSERGYNAWSNTNLQFKVNLGSLSSSPLYLYVTNWTGETNSAGYLLEGEEPPVATATISGMTFNGVTRN